MNQPKIVNSALSDATVVFASRIWVAISAIAVQSLLAWLLGPADRGSYAVCLMFATLLGVLFCFGADRGSQYFIMSGKIAVSDALSAMIWIIGTGTLVAMLIGFILIDSPLEFFQKAERSAFLLAILLIPLTTFLTAFRLQLAGLRRFVSLAKIDIARTALGLLLVLLLVGGLNRGVDGALEAQLLCVFTVIVIAIANFRRHDGFRFVKPQLTDARLISAYGARYYVARIGHVIDSGLGTLLLAFFATRVELGLFAAASALTLSILMVADSVELVLLPRIAADDLGRPLLVARVARVSALISAAFVLLLVAVCEPLVRILLSPEFLNAVPLIRWLAIGVVVQGFNIILMSFFRGSNYPHICSWTVWIGLTINALGIALLYPVLGVAGAAIAMSLGFVARSISLVVMFCRINKVSFADLIRPARSDFDMMSRILRQVLDNRRSQRDNSSP